ncbi:MAG: dihydrodipicolinate reductase C-terminal domain-containing protein, partial [Ignavibacteria bacterium]
HSAKNRTGFAQGAILAAEWIMNKKGLHEFSEVFQ